MAGENSPAVPLYIIGILMESKENAQRIRKEVINNFIDPHNYGTGIFTHFERLAAVLVMGK